MTTNPGRCKTAPFSVHVGFRFHPTEEELVTHYLNKKIHGGNDSEIDHFIPFIDLCEHEPAQLPSLLGSDEMEWFFFTRNAYKYNKSSRSNRTTEKGFWKITGKEREIKARHSKAVVGKKRTLTFYHGRGEAKKKKTCWVIHEYYLPRTEAISYSKQEKGELVICRLKYKSDKDPSVSNEEPMDDCCSSTGWSPASQWPEAVLQTNRTSGDCYELRSRFGNSESCLLDRNGVLTCDEDETLYDAFPQLCDPREENMDSLLRAFTPQDFYPPILQSATYTKQGDVSDTNICYGESNYWQSESMKTISTDEVSMPVRYVMYDFKNHDYTTLEEPRYSTEVYTEYHGRI